MATDISAITSSALSVGTEGARQFQGLFDVIPFVVSLLDTTQAADTAATTDVAVTGAALGDFVLIAPKVDLTDGMIVGQVSAADVVTLTVWNPEGTDAITPFATAKVCNGLVLKPRSNIWAAL